jgi:hypothetical protein
MALPRELLFVDPSVSDLGTILRNLRPEVEAIVLDAASRPARQIALALQGRHDLDAVHVIAHGAPGRISFSAGPWSLETLADNADDLAAIGEALRDYGGLQIWSCHTGEGARGRAFVDALSRATGAHVAAAAKLVGSPGLGGCWELEGQRRDAIPQPLTDAGVAAYAGVFAVTLASTGRGERLGIVGSWPVGTPAGTYFIVLNYNDSLEVIGKFIVPTNVGGTFAISEPLPAGSYTVGPMVAGPSTIAVYDGNCSAEGTWSPSNFNSEITATLNVARNVASNHSNGTGAIR